MPNVFYQPKAGSRLIWTAVLYTGKTTEPSIVIDCARWGATEYLMKGAVSGDVLAKTLYLLAQDPNNTVGKLSAPSASVQQVIQEAEENMLELNNERMARQRLETENGSLRSGERREIYAQAGRFIAAVVCLCFVGILLWFTSQIGNGLRSFGFSCVGALAGLFILDRSLSRLVIRHGKSQLGLTRRQTK